MSDDHERDALIRGEIEKNRHDIRAVVRIQISRWFIREEHLWFIYNCSCDRDSLLFAARKFCGQMVGAVSEAHAA